jgi:mannose/fructose/N-acetylgalactosamine-specific phosphotransferase system component IID
MDRDLIFLLALVILNIASIYYSYKWGYTSGQINQIESTVKTINSIFKFRTK